MLQILRHAVDESGKRLIQLRVIPTPYLNEFLCTIRRIIYKLSTRDVINVQLYSFTPMGGVVPFARQFHTLCLLFLANEYVPVIASTSTYYILLWYRSSTARFVRKLLKVHK